MLELSYRGRIETGTARTIITSHYRLGSAHVWSMFDEMKKHKWITFDNRWYINLLVSEVDLE